MFNLTLKKYKAIVFDCDGVLVDTEQLKLEAWQTSLQKRGISLTADEYIPYVGYSSIAIVNYIKEIKKVVFDEKQLILEKNAIYHQKQKHGVPLIEPAVHFLKQLLRNKIPLNIKVAIVSSAAHSEIHMNLSCMGLCPTDFDAVLSGKDDLLHGGKDLNKPFPHIYQLCSKKIGIAPEDCLVFEDTSAGVQAAINAGMQVIAVPNEFTKKHVFPNNIQRGAFNEATSFELF